MCNNVLCLCRCHDNPRVGGGAGYGVLRTGVRSVGAAGSTILPNSTYGAHGPSRWHLETPGLRCLRTSTGIIKTNNLTSTPLCRNNNGRKWSQFSNNNEKWDRFVSLRRGYNKISLATFISM